MSFQKFRYLDFAIKDFTMNKEKLTKLSMKKLKSMIDYAYRNIPYYHRTFKICGIKPEDIRKPEDFKKIPLITKDDVIKNYKVFLNPNVNAFDSRSTSGTTGKPLLVQFDRTHAQTTSYIFLRQLFAIGYKPWSKVLYFDSKNWKPSNFEKTLGIFKLFRKKVVNEFISDEKLIEIITNFQPDIIITSPSYTLTKMISLKEELNEKILILGGENVTKDMKKNIKKKFNLSNIFEWYSCWEFGYLAWECKNHSKLHINIDSNFFEFLNEDNDDVCEDERGNVVITSLTNHKMPLIRYKIGDVAIPSNDTCACGLPFPLIDKIEGRNDDIIKLSDGRQIPPDQITSLFLSSYDEDGTIQMRIIQESFSKFTIVTSAKGIPKTFISKLKKLIGKEVTINVKFSNEVFPADKKHRFVESKVR